MPATATSLKMPAELKARVDAAAKAAGTTSHAFMVGAIERETRRAESYAAFVSEAKDADREFERAGIYYELEDVFRYLGSAATRKPARRRRRKSWPR